MPESHRWRYADEQVRLFEQVWMEERPDGGIAQLRWACVLIVQSVLAAIGARLDVSRRGGYARNVHRRGGAGMGSDFRFTLRSVRASSWYAVAVVGVIAVTMALATTAFAIVDGVLFQPLAFQQSDRLFRIEPGFTNIGQAAAVPGGAVPTFGASHIDLLNWQSAVPEVPMTGFRAQPWMGLGAGVNDSTAGVALIQPNFFDVFGVAPLFGGFSAQDFVDEPRLRPVLASYDVWTSRYESAPDIVGREIITDRAGGYGVRIVGVMPKGFVFPTARAEVHFLSPLVSPAAARNDPGVRFISEVVVRLPEGLTPEVLRERLAPALSATARQFPARGPKPDGWSDAGWRRQGPFDAVSISTLAESLGRRSRPLFMAVFAAVLLLLAIAAVNVSSLMTARALERQHEIGVRRSLGAGPWAIARLWTVEAATLLTLGGVAGVLASPLLLDLFLRLLPSDVVLLKPARLDWRVAGFVAMTLALLSALVAVAPIRRSLTRRSLSAAGSQTRGASERVRTPGRRLVVALQVGVAFVLTVGGASLVGSLLTVYAHELPIRTRGIVVLKVMLQGPGNGGMDLSPERAERERALRTRLASVRGVSSVASTAAQVLAGGGNMTWFLPPAGTKHPANIDTWPVTEGFYDTLAPEVIEGRLPSNDELRASAPLVVVSQRAAQAYWPGKSALGATLTDQQSKVAFTVVGVVKDVRWLAWDIETPVVYGPYAAVGRAPWLTYFLRTDGNTGSVTADALRAIEERDPLAGVSRADTLDSVFRDSVSIRRFQSWLFGGFAAAALVVVGVGIFGLIAMAAARRTKEVGIRCALGATPGALTTLMVREQLGAVAVGLLVGGLVAAWAVRFVESYLFELTTADPRIWLSATVLVLLTACAGALIPAWRASRIDPLKALRVE